MVTLKKIQLYNFLSHKNTEFIVEGHNKILIDGKSGSGKSSIIDGLIWCLYGRGRSDNRSLIKRGSKTARVITMLNDDKVCISIERSISLNGKHTLNILSGENEKKLIPVNIDGIKAQQDYIEKDILRASYILFVNSVIYPQDNIDSFVKQTAAKRKDMVMEMARVDSYDKYYDSAKKIYESLSLDINALQIKELNNLEDITRYTTVASFLDTYIKDESSIKEKYDVLELKLRDNIERQGNLKLITNKINTLKDKIIDIEHTISFLRNDADVTLRNVNNCKNINKEKVTAMHVDILNKKRALDAEIEKKNAWITWNVSLTNIQQSMPSEFDYTKDIERINKQIIGLMTKEKVRCAKCGEPVAFFEERASDEIHVLEMRLKEIGDESLKYNDLKIKFQKDILNLGTKPVFDEKLVDKLTAEISRIPEIERMYQEMLLADKRIIDDEKKLSDITQRINEYTEQKNKIETELSQFPESINNELAAMQKEEVDISLSKSEYSVELTKLAGKIALAKDALDRVKECESNIINLKKEREKLTEDFQCIVSVRDAFSNTGVKTIVIDYILPRLEDRVNNILEKFSDFRIRFETQKGGIKEDTVIEGLFISIMNGQGEVFDLDNYSGGEKMRIIIALSEGLAEIQNVGFRILDEAIVGIDDDTIDGFIRTLLIMEERFSQLITISHLQAVKNMFDDVISVVNINGDSKIII